MAGAVMSVPSDVRYGLRKLNNNVGFTAVAVLCLALGIGANVTVFSVVNALLLRPVSGVTDPSRLVSLTGQFVRLRGMEASVSKSLSYPDLEAYRKRVRALSGLEAHNAFSANLVTGAKVLRVRGEIVTDGYFTTLGVQSALGHLFAPGRAQREPHPEVVLAHSFWQRALGGRREAVGAPMTLNGRVFTVAGVAAADFRGTLHGEEVDLWVPVETAPVVLPHVTEAALADPQSDWLFRFVGRLAPGVDLKEAQAELDALARDLAVGRPEPPTALQVYPGVGLSPGQQEAVAGVLTLLSVVVGLLMLVVCANLGGLLLVRAATRREEMGVRLALGVTRSRLIRQLLTESVTLSLFGGAAGFMVALFATELLRGVALGQTLPRLPELQMDVRVVAFTVALSFAAGLLFGMVPALWATRPRGEPIVRRGGEVGADRSRTRLQEIFVVGQVMVSLVLLVTTGLFVRTLRNLQEISPGFDSRGVVNARMELDRGRYQPAEGIAFYEQLLEQVRARREVSSAALALSVPLQIGPGSRGRLTSAVPPPESGLEPLFLESNLVSPGYFQTLGIPLREGRDFSPEDREGAPRVVIVNEALANAFWPGKSPVGRHLIVGERSYEIVGVAGNLRLKSLEAGPSPLVYRPLAQAYDPSMNLHVRTQVAPRIVAERLRAIASEMDPSIPLFEVSPYDEQVRRAVAQPRLLSTLFGTFSLIAVFVTAIGLYGTLAYSVSRRTRELGIRIALGARASEIVSLVLRRGLALTLTGLVLGVGTALWTTSVFASLLFGVEPTDPAVFFLVSLLLAAVGLAASSLPAYSATRVDPMAVIRHE
jgi:predicted permease